jgi:hypothetical protein
LLKGGNVQIRAFGFDDPYGETRMLRRVSIPAQ